MEYSYYFDKWILQENTNPYDIIYTASFTSSINSYCVVLKSQNDQIIKVDGQGIYEYSSSVEISAHIIKEPTGFDMRKYRFIGWYDDYNNLVSKESDFTFTMPGYNLCYTAKYEDSFLEIKDKISFGNYPQAEVTDSNIIDYLNLLAFNGKPSLTIMNKFMYGDLNLLTNYYYLDLDINSDGFNDYRCIYFEKYRSQIYDNEEKENDMYQFKNGYYKNTFYWFKYEPIVWSVFSIDSNNVKLFSDFVLDASYYSLNNNYYYNSSLIKTFLDNQFGRTSFNSLEQSKITNHIVQNNSNGYITPLDVDDANYGASFFAENDHSLEKENKVRLCTKYAECMGVINWIGNLLQQKASIYWLVPANEKIDYYIVGNDGNLFPRDCNKIAGICPSITLLNNNV